MLICPRLIDFRHSCRIQYVIHTERRRTYQLLDICRIAEQIEMQNCGGINLQIGAFLPFRKAVPFSVDFLRKLIAKRINAGGQPPCHSILGIRHIAENQHRRNQKSSCREVKNIIHQSTNISCGTLCIRISADILVFVPVKFRQNPVFGCQKRLYLIAQHLAKDFVPALLAVLAVTDIPCICNLADVYLQVSAAAPFVILHCRLHQSYV